MPSAKIVAQNPAGSFNPASSLGQPESAAAADGLTRNRAAVQASGARDAKRSTNATQQTTRTAQRNRFMAAFPPHMQPSMGRCMRFNTRDINTSIRFEAGGARVDRIVTACLQRPTQEGRVRVFLAGFLRSGSTVPADWNRPQAVRACFGRGGRSSARKKEAQLSDSRAAGLQACAVWIPPLCLCYIDRLCYIFLG